MRTEGGSARPARAAAKSMRVPTGGTRVALVRGINVGRAKRVAMADLRRLLERLGHREVRTLLNSGNAVFVSGRGTPDSIAAAIEKGLATEIRVPARVLVLEARDVVEIVRANPLLDRARDPTRLFVNVLFDPADRAKLKPLARRDWGEERLAIGARVSYVWCPDGLLASPLAAAVGRALGDRVTVRNWATMLKLHGAIAAER